MDARDREDFKEVDILMDSLEREELNRAKYVLRAYLRARLKKVERFAAHLLRTNRVEKKMSKKEAMFAKDLVVAFQTHTDSVLSHLPRNYQDQLSEVGTEEISMVSKPNTKTYAFFRLLKDVGDFSFLNENGERDAMDLNKGNILCLRFEEFKALLEKDEDGEPRAELV